MRTVRAMDLTAIGPAITALLADYDAALFHAVTDLRWQRDMYRAAWHVACAQQQEIERLKRQLGELHEERARYARALFGAQADGEDVA